MKFHSASLYSAASTGLGNKGSSAAGGDLKITSHQMLNSLPTTIIRALV